MPMQLMKNFKKFFRVKNKGNENCSGLQLQRFFFCAIHYGNDIKNGDKLSLMYTKMIFKGSGER